MKPCLEHNLSSIRFVQVSGHASEECLAMIGGSISWQKFGKLLCETIPELKRGQRRVLCLSVCYSPRAVELLAPLLVGRFTAIYYLCGDEVEFANSMVVWGMFYLEKGPGNPHSRIVKRVNAHFRREVLAFRKLVN